MSFKRYAEIMVNLSQMQNGIKAEDANHVKEDKNKRSKMKTLLICLYNYKRGDYITPSMSCIRLVYQNGYISLISPNVTVDNCELNIRIKSGKTKVKKNARTLIKRMLIANRLELTGKIKYMVYTEECNHSLAI